MLPEPRGAGQGRVVAGRTDCATAAEVRAWEMLAGVTIGQVEEDMGRRERGQALAWQSS